MRAQPHELTGDTGSSAGRREPDRQEQVYENIPNYDRWLALVLAIVVIAGLYWLPSLAHVFDMRPPT